MAELKSMKLSPTEKKEMVVGVDREAPEYPWGLQLNLDDDTVDRLEKPALRVGDEVTILAKAKVQRVSTSEDDRDEGKIDISMTLQITDMAVEEAADPKETAERLFPSMKKES